MNAEGRFTLGRDGCLLVISWAVLSLIGCQSSSGTHMDRGNDNSGPIENDNLSEQPGERGDPCSASRRCGTGLACIDGTCDLQPNNNDNDDGLPTPPPPPPPPPDDNDLERENPSVDFDNFCEGNNVTLVAVDPSEGTTFRQPQEECSCFWTVDGSGTFDDAADCITNYSPSDTDQEISLTVDCSAIGLDSVIFTQRVTVDNCGCTVDVDCDDGLFCNGSETCDLADGSCNDGSNPCDAGETCNESANRCQCDSHDECDDNLFCNGTEICSNGSCQDGQDPCLQECDEGTDSCSCDTQVFVIPDKPLLDESGRLIVPRSSFVTAPTANAGLIMGNGTSIYLIEGVETTTDSYHVTYSQSSVAGLCITGEFQFDNGSTLPAARRTEVEANLSILEIYESFSNDFILADDGSVVATVTGTFDLVGEFYLYFDVGFGGLESFASSIGGAATMDMGFEITAQGGAEVEKEYELTEPRKFYFNGFIGFFPVVVEVTAQLFTGFDGEVAAEASITTGVSAEADVEVGAEYNPNLPLDVRWSPIAEAGFDWGFDEPAACAEGSGNIRAYLRPHFEVQLYTVVGPTFDLVPYLKLDGSIEGCLGDDCAPYELDLIAGVEGTAKIKADVLDLFVIESREITVIDIAETLESWSNEDNCGCTSDEDCEEGETCDNVSGECIVGPAGECDSNEDCDDDIYCNGAELCSSGSCLDVADPCSSDEACNEGANRCDDCDSNADCDDDLYCNGAEICSSGSCLDGADPCSSHEGCNEGANRCDICDSNSDCDDNLYCNGTETCSSGSCLDGANPCSSNEVCNEGANRCDICDSNSDCDDNLYCNGTEICSSGSCLDSADPCGGQFCDELGNDCDDCLLDSDCDDDDPCTIDDCDIAGNCGFIPDDSGDTNPSCSSALTLGYVSGDTGADVASYNYDAERWYSVEIVEEDLFPDSLGVKVELDPDADTDYDLCVYCLSCVGGEADCSWNLAGVTDTVLVGWEDELFVDDTADILIEVFYYEGCGDYELSVIGNVSVTEYNCDP